MSIRGIFSMVFYVCELGGCFFNTRSRIIAKNSKCSSLQRMADLLRILPDPVDAQGTRTVSAAPAAVADLEAT